MSDTVRVLIVDPSPEQVTEIQAILSEEQDMEVVGTASAADEALRLATELQPDIVLLGSDLPDCILFASTVIRRAIRSTVILTGDESEKDLARKAWGNGMASYVKMASARERLAPEVRKTASQHKYLSLIPLIEPQPVLDGQTIARLHLIGQNWVDGSLKQPLPEEETIEVTHIGQQIALFDGTLDRSLLQVIKVEPGKLGLYVSGRWVRQGAERKMRGLDLLKAPLKSQITLVPGETIELYPFILDGGKIWEVTLRWLSA